MRSVVQVFLASIGFSILFSLVLSIVQYTPLERREPNIYYFSIGESFAFTFLLLTPYLVLISLIAYLVYRFVFKRFHINLFIKGFVSVVVSAAAVLLTIFFIDKNDVTNDLYLIPEGYEGNVMVFYNVKGAPEVEKEDGFDVHVINEEGYYVTSTPNMDYGTVTDKYFYVDERGNRTPIDDHCVSLFGTGSFSTSRNEEIDLHYTGFNLTKDHCSEEFMLGEGSSSQKKNNMLEEVLRKYYGIGLE